MSLFSKNIYLLRKEKQLQQVEMVDFVGVQRVTWSDYEKGRTEPKFESLVRIAEFFDIFIDDLLLKDLQLEFAKGNIYKKSELQILASKGNFSGNNLGNNQAKNDNNQKLNAAAEAGDLYDKSSLKEVIEAVQVLQHQIAAIASKIKV